MDRHEQHGEFSTRGFLPGLRERTSRPFEHAGARITAAARALRGAPFRAPAAGLMILAVTLATGTDILRATEPGSSRAPDTAIEVREIPNADDPAIPEPVSEKPSTGALSDEPAEDEIEPVDEPGYLEDEVCSPERIEPLPDPTGVRVAWSEYREDRSVIFIRDLGNGSDIDVSGGCDAYAPSFRDGRSVTYLLSEYENGEHRQVVMRVNLGTGIHRRITSRPEVMAYAWDPSGSRLATIDSGAWTQEGSTAGSTIEILDVGSGDTLTIPLPDFVEGRCGWLGDEQALHWSPDGSSIAVVVTAFDNDATLRVLDLGGNELIAPRAGTMARWLDDDRLLYEDYGFDEGTGWHIIDVRTGELTDPGLRRDTYGPAISQTGARVATFDDPGTLFVHTLANGVERRHAGLIHPHWVDARHVLATNVRPCPEDCFYEFEETGSSSIVDVVDGERVDVDIPHLWRAAVWVPPTTDQL
ncbi:MAG TPA: hypothetical protein VGB52_14545 [Actinomycetota bacterium]